MNDEELTEREEDVILLMLAGKSDCEIAAHLGISYHTARTHTNNIRRKLGVSSRYTAVMRWLMSERKTRTGDADAHG